MPVIDTAAGVLDALESVLALERELGARTVEMDRSLLRDGPPPELRPAPLAAAPAPAPAPVPVADCFAEPRAFVDASAKPAEPAAKAVAATANYAFIFDSLPKDAAEEMVTKIIAAMKCQPGAVVRMEATEAAKKRPRARIYVVMGSDARKIFMPSKPAVRGQWTEVDGVPTLVTYSPARLLRFFANDVVRLDQSKREMWRDLQSAMARLKVETQK